MAVTKRIFQLSKEFERDEKEIIAFLATQGIKVSNRLSAVTEDAYNMLKEKFMAPPPPPPEPKPESKPEPAPEVKEVAPAQPTTSTEQPQPVPSGKKKKKKNKQPQPAPETPPQDGESPPEEKPEKEVSDLKLEHMERRTKNILFQGIMAGNEFIKRYSQNPGQTPLNKQKKPILTADMDVWGILFNHKVVDGDSSPVQYWTSVAKLMTRAFKILNGFGLLHREELAAMRDDMVPVGKKYEPREIFTDEENQKFAEQQRFLFLTFGHGIGDVNDNLYALKTKAERMKIRYEHMSFLEYVTNPQDELRSNERVPFMELAESVAHSLRGVVRRFEFYQTYKKRIDRIIQKFFEWIEGYAKLKEQGAPAEKLEKYLKLEGKFIDIVEFMAFDNNLVVKSYDKKDKPSPFDTMVELLETYRDNLDDPDAERIFKYKVRGVTNILYKPKEYVFAFEFGDLEPMIEYRTPEEIAAYEAAKAAALAEKENPAADDEA